MPEQRPRRRGGRPEIAILTLPPFIWLVVFFLIPVLILAAVSFSPAGMTVEIFRAPSLDQYRQTLDAFYLSILLRSLGYAAAATLITLLIAFPAAYFIASSPPRLLATTPAGLAAVSGVSAVVDQPAGASLFVQDHPGR